MKISRLSKWSEKFLIKRRARYKKVLTSETYNHYIFSKILVFKRKNKIKIEFFKTSINFEDDIPRRIKKE